MLWQFWVGRFLQAVAGVGALLTLVDWIRLGSAQIRVGHIVVWSIVGGALAASISTWNVRRRPCALPTRESGTGGSGSDRSR